MSPGNTVASFEAALRCGVDMIEFDVLPMPDGRFVLAHDPSDALAREPLTLEEGLAIFAGTAYDDVSLCVDLKVPGYEREVVEGLGRHDLLDRALVSSTYPESLKLIGRLHPGVERGWSVPRATRDYTQNLFLALPAYAILRWWRAGLPSQAERAIRRGECEALMAHRLLVSPLLVERVHAAGARLFVWTVDDGEEIARLEALGVDGVISNDPRLFATPG